MDQKRIKQTLLRQKYTLAQLQNAKQARAISRSSKRRPLYAFRPNAPSTLLDIPRCTDAIQYGTPSWFTYTEKADTSIIVPLFRSVPVLKDLIASWEFNDRTEIIYVDDNCPLNSKENVVSLWHARRQEKPIGRIFYSLTNQGFSVSCNIGAFHATGDYLIFLNADTVVTSGWLRPIVRLLKKPEVGIVGNLQLKYGTELIDSAGSQWDWDNRTFFHIGRDIYNHHHIQPLPLDRCPSDLLETQEREMITGSCLGIRKELYEKVGGFNLNYRLGYWEDADLCMTVREKGYKVMYQPNSKIYHKGGHSGANRHKYQNHNANYFANKWIISGRIDPLVSSPRPVAFPNVKHILLKRSSAIGDVLLAASVAPALKKRYPGSKITFVTNCTEVLEDNPYIDKIVQQSDIPFQLYYNLDIVYECRSTIPILQAYAEEVGVKQGDCQLFLKTSPVENLPQKYMVFHCGNTGWAGRDWSIIKFKILANRINLPIVCVGSESDHPLTDCLNLVGKTSISQLAYVIKNAHLFIGIDSFPMHVAQTFNIPGVCFFGCVDPATRIFRLNMKAVKAPELKCLGCHHRKFPPCTSTTVCEIGITECINLVTVENILSEVDQILGKL